MFNSPMAFCTVCRSWIALDEGSEACTAHMQCNVSPCPLQAYRTSAYRPASGGMIEIDCRRSEPVLRHQEELQLPPSHDDSTAGRGLTTRKALGP